MDYKAKLLDKVDEDKILETIRSLDVHSDLMSFTKRLKNSKALTPKVMRWYMFIHVSSPCLNVLKHKFPSYMVSQFCQSYPIDACNLFYSRLQEKDIDEMVIISPINMAILLQNHPYYKEKYATK